MQAEHLSIIFGVLAFTGLVLAMVRALVPLDWPNHRPRCRHCDGRLEALGEDVDACPDCECRFDAFAGTVLEGQAGEGCPNA